jgi:hypothetical protein
VARTVIIKYLVKKVIAVLKGLLKYYWCDSYLDRHHCLESFIMVLLTF